MCLLSDLLTFNKLHILYNPTLHFLRLLNQYDFKTHFSEKKGKGSCPEDPSECDKTEDATGSAKRKRRKRKGPLIEDVVIGK